MDTQIYRFRKWTNYIYWYQNRCFEIKDEWLHYYWNTDDIGKVVRGSMNLSNAKAQRVNSRTLHLSNHDMTYYLKSDSDSDMDAFVNRLIGLNVNMSNN